MKRKSKTGKTRFWVEVVAEIEIDDDVLADGMSDDFAEYITRFNSKEEVASHIAYNMIVNNIGLSQIDGYETNDDNKAKFIHRPSVQDVYIEKKL